MTHYVEDVVTGRALCGVVVPPDDQSLEPDCPVCRARIVAACRAVAEAWVLPEDES